MPPSGGPAESGRPAASQDRTEFTDARVEDLLSADSTDAGVDRKSQRPATAPAMATMASQRTLAAVHMKKANPSANNATVRASDPPSSATHSAVRAHLPRGARFSAPMAE